MLNINFNVSEKSNKEYSTVEIFTIFGPSYTRRGIQLFPQNVEPALFKLHVQLNPQTTLYVF